jgi:hypothetical protein
MRISHDIRKIAAFLRMLRLIEPLGRHQVLWFQRPRPKAFSLKKGYSQRWSKNSLLLAEIPELRDKAGFPKNVLRFCDSPLMPVKIRIRELSSQMGTKMGRFYA